MTSLREYWKSLAESWRDSAFNTSSWWDISARDKTSLHQNSLHGNFVPQIPMEMISRYTMPGDVVFDPFLGSGTTLIECVDQQRMLWSVDLNPENSRAVRKALSHAASNFVFIHGDSTSVQLSDAIVALSEAYSRKVALSILHPPYLDIIKFNDDRRCLSNMTLDKFMVRMGRLLDLTYSVGSPGGHLVIVVGDVWDRGNRALIPLGSKLQLSAISSGWIPVATVVKNVKGTRVQQKNRNLWRYRSLRNGTFTFEHEYVHVFRKEG